MDLHVHTPKSYDFTDHQVTATDIVRAAQDARLDAIAICDHNTAAGITDVVASAANTSLFVFPGVELTTSEGAHLLAIFGPNTSADAVTALLGACGVRGDQIGRPEGRARYDFVRCVEHAATAGAVCIAAHADHPGSHDGKGTGVLSAVRPGGPLQEVLQHEALHAAEICTDDPKVAATLACDPVDGREIRSLVRASDAHALRHIGSSSTLFKMTRPTAEGLRLALADGPTSVRPLGPSDAVIDPNDRVARLVVESIAVSDAKLLGRGDAFVLELNPWLNALIGGFGTGKSSVIEFGRLALDRHGELAGALRSAFDERMRIPAGREDRGMLSEATKVTVTYRKDDQRFRVVWEHGEHRIESQRTDGAWERAAGAVTSRFPIRMYSQKQVFGLAEGPEALLRIIDEASEVDLESWKDSWRRTRERFLALRAQAREFAVALAEKDRLTGELDDLQRKLTVFETSGHSEVLTAYAKRRRQSEAVAAWERGVETLAEAVERAAATPTAPFDTQGCDLAEPGDASLTATAAERQHLVAGVRQELDALAARLRAAAKGSDGDDTVAPWKSAVAEAERAYSELMRRLDAEGAGSPSQYAELVDQRGRIEARLNELATARDSLVDVERDAATALDELLELRRELTRRRRKFVQGVLASNPHVRIDVVAYGDRDDAERQLRHVLGREDGTFAVDIAGENGTGLLGEVYRDFASMAESDIEDRLARMRAQLIGCAADSGVWTPRYRRFAEHLQALAPEALDRLAFWAPADTVRVSHSRSGDGRTFEPIEQGSPGQKTAAILAFLLSYGDEPIVLDQPEDDLDNRLISNLIVRQLRENKRRRQIIVISHNPNIVVNADAEHVGVLDFIKGQTRLRAAGGLQEAAVREQVCTVIEGGREAFEQRYRRIGRRRS